MTLRDDLEREAARPRRGGPARSTDDAVTHALERAAQLVGERRDAIAAANAADVDGGARLDEGSLDRLRLDAARIDALAEQLAQLAALPPLERDEDAWELDNGLHVVGAPDPDRRRRRELRGAAERRDRRCRPAAEVA